MLALHSTENPSRPAAKNVTKVLNNTVHFFIFLQIFFINLIFTSIQPKVKHAVVVWIRTMLIFLLMNPKKHETALALQVIQIHVTATVLKQYNNYHNRLKLQKEWSRWIHCKHRNNLQSICRWGSCLYRGYIFLKILRWQLQILLLTISTTGAEIDGDHNLVMIKYHLKFKILKKALAKSSKSIKSVLKKTKLNL